MSYVDVADNASSALMESNLSSPPPVRQGGSSLHPEQVRQRRSSSGFHTPRSPGSRRASSVRGAEYPQLTAKGSAAMQPGATQETIKDYVFSLLEAHADTVEGWNKRVRVVELYRNKQLRQGGEAAAVRPADIAFLERVEHSSEHYMNVIGRAKDLLEAQRDASEDRKDTVSRAWHQYCVRYYGELHDLWLDVSMIHRRTQRLLAVPLQHDPYTPSKFRTDSAPRGRSTSVASQRSRATSVSSRQPSQVLDGTLTCTSPIAKLRRSSSRGGSRPSVSQSSVRRGSEILRPGINGRLSQVHPYRLSIAAEDAPSTTLTGRPLHPSTVLPNTLIGSPYDEKTPYGRLSPYRFDPQRTAAEELYVVDEDSVLADGEVREAGRAEEPSGIVSDHEGEVAVCETSRTTRQSLSRRRSSQAPPEPADYTPQLVTYRSHRGASPVSAEPEVDPARRLQLLETIQFYTKNAEDLDKGHLKAARECFLELFGQQRGLRQYSNWIDDLALQAIRSKK